jgi:hypothetical protein
MPSMPFGDFGAIAVRRSKSQSRLSRQADVCDATLGRRTIDKAAPFSGGRLRTGTAMGPASVLS